MRFVGLQFLKKKTTHTHTPLQVKNCNHRLTNNSFYLFPYFLSFAPSIAIYVVYFSNKLCLFLFFFCLAESCAQLFTHGRRSNGFYNIRIPDNASLPRNQTYIRVWCDMDGINGGWILLQQRINVHFNFLRSWNSYEKGFGEPGFGYWLGNSYMHAITLNRKYVLRFEFLDYVDERNQMLFLEFDNFQVLSSLKYYTIQTGKYRGNMANIMDINNFAFSTWDRDNDKSKRACAIINRGAWWYGSDCYITDPNSMLQFLKVTMKAKEVLGGNGL